MSPVCAISDLPVNTRGPETLRHRRLEGGRNDGLRPAAPIAALAPVVAGALSDDLSPLAGLGPVVPAAVYLGIGIHYLGSGRDALDRILAPRQAGGVFVPLVATTF